MLTNTLPSTELTHPRLSIRAHWPSVSRVKSVVDDEHIVGVVADQGGRHSRTLCACAHKLRRAGGLNRRGQARLHKRWKPRWSQSESRSVSPPPAGHEWANRQFSALPSVILFLAAVAKKERGKKKTEQQ